MPTVRSLLAAGCALAAFAGTAAAAVDVEPTADTTRFVLRVVDARGPVTAVSQDGADRFTMLPLALRSPFDRVVRVRGTETARFAGGSGRTVRGHPAAPDGFGGLDLLDVPLDSVVGRARAGTLALRPVTVGGRAALRTTFPVPANDCAALRRGTATVDLDRATLLPLRYVTRRAGAPTQTLRLEVRRTGAALPARLFRPLPRRAGETVFDPGFRRVSPAAAAARLPYAPLLPATVPAGFALAVSGWAPRSAITGPEGSIPARPSLFQAVYARGWERLELTMRRAAAGRDWPEDPFGVECGRVDARPVTVRGVQGTFGVGPLIRPHLLWREGGVLLTLSGPFPAETLVQVADSLAPVTATP